MCDTAPALPSERTSKASFLQRIAARTDVVVYSTLFSDAWAWDAWACDAQAWDARAWVSYGAGYDEGG